MPRYITRPKADMDCDGWDTGRLYDNINVRLTDPVDTGLLDSEGTRSGGLQIPSGSNFSGAVRSKLDNWRRA